MFKKEKYNPLLFLSSLWAGGMSVVFFMYLMFMIPRDHKNFVIPTFDSLMLQFDKGDLWFNALIIFAVIWIILTAFKHIQLLILNLKRYFEFKKTKAFETLKTGNGEVTLMALPLTLAMTVNVLFILWAVFIPWLWGIVEYLFPGALVAFLLVWLLALKIFFEYFVRLILQKWNDDFVNNNSLSQMLSVFAFTMVAVWFAASAAMSTNEISILLWLIGSIFFITIAIFLTILKWILWFKAIFKHWLDRAASPTLWIFIPILTLIGITLVRQFHWLHEFGGNTSTASFITLTTTIISLQIMFGYLGYKVMKANHYFRDFVHGKEKNPGTFALICPWVASVVFGFFFLHLGLVASGVVEKFSIIYFILLLPLLYIQFKTIYVMLKLNKKFGL